MSFELTQKAIDTDAPMSPSVHAVLVVLCRFANDAGGDCFPSTATLAKRTRLNARTVMTAIKTLSAEGWVSCSQKAGGVRGFQINVAKLQSCEPLQDPAPLHESTPLQDPAPLQVSAVPPCKKLQGAPVGKCSTPLQETAPYKNIEETNYENKEENSCSKPRSRAPLVRFPDSLSDEWIDAAYTVRTDVDPHTVYMKLRAKYAPTTIKKAAATWRKEFLNWIGTEFARKPKYQPVQEKTDFRDEFNEDGSYKWPEPVEFSKEYYESCKNPDGSVDWGI